MKIVNTSDILIDLRDASSRLNKYRYLSANDVISTRKRGIFVSELSPEETRLLEFSVVTARDSLRSLMVSMEKASILLQQETVNHNVTALRRDNLELQIICAISMGDIMRIAYSNDRCVYTRTSRKFNSALDALRDCVNASNVAYKALCEIHNAHV